MLNDKTEIDIISKARQANVRDPKRSREHFYRIFEDFFQSVPLTGHYVDCGPGQYDFGEIVRDKGGACTGIEKDPAVLELGRYKGFQVIDMDLRHLGKNEIGQSFDGIFNKFSLNAFWTWDDDEKHTKLIDEFTGLMKKNAWAWIAPWNGVPKKVKLSDAQIKHVLKVQTDRFLAHGFSVVDLTPHQTKYYGVHGTVANNPVFLKNLAFKPSK